jgi:PIN domain nuclease of toxin-antitoxin system
VIETQCVRALLDTHAFIWWADDDPSLSPAAKGVIADRSNEIFLSAITSWEMAILSAIGKLSFAQPVSSFVSAQMTQYNFQPLMVTHEHTFQVETMTMHHKDPFDRLLIAQAIVENLILLTRDSEFAPYGVPTLW